MSYWAAAQLENNRVALATHHLKLSGYRVYAPRLRTYRFSSGTPGRGAAVAVSVLRLRLDRPAVAPRALVLRVIRLIMAGDATPARVPDTVIDGLRAPSATG